jgi:hypothetical protein
MGGAGRLARVVESDAERGPDCSIHSQHLIRAEFTRVILEAVAERLDVLARAVGEMRAAGQVAELGGRRTSL